MRRDQFKCHSLRSPGLRGHSCVRRTSKHTVLAFTILISARAACRQLPIPQIPGTFRCACFVLLLSTRTSTATDILGQRAVLPALRFQKERGDCPRAGRRNCCPWFRRASFQLFCWDLAVPLSLGKILAQLRSRAERLIFDQRTTCNSMSVFRLAAQLRLPPGHIVFLAAKRFTASSSESDSNSAKTRLRAWYPIFFAWCSVTIAAISATVGAANKAWSGTSTWKVLITRETTRVAASE